MAMAEMNKLADESRDDKCVWDDVCCICKEPLVKNVGDEIEIEAFDTKKGTVFMKYHPKCYKTGQRVYPINL
jgi:hypothetical protein